MKKILSLVLVLASLFSPAMLNTVRAVSSVNGPLTFTSIVTSNYPVTVGKTTITVNGSGFNHINKVLLGSQSSLTPMAPEITDYYRTDTQFYFLLPSSIIPGQYQIQVNTDDNSGRVVLDNNAPWIFTAAADTSTGITPSITKLSPTSVQVGASVNVTGKGFLGSNDVNLRSSIFGSTTVTNAQVTTNSSTSLSFIVPSYLTTGQYDVSVINANGESSPSLLNVNRPIITDPVPTADAHPIGTNVKFPNGAVYRIVAGPNRSAYTSANIFLSYKFNKWSDVVPATSGDEALSVTTPMPARDGSLLNDKGTIYIISEGKARQPFGSFDVFKGYGYSLKNVYNSESSYLETYPTMTSSNLIHPDGTLINNKGTLYIMNSHYRLGVPSIEVLESWGYWLSDAVPANSYDMSVAMSAVLAARPFNQYRY